jgi:hypothetical protein
MKKRHRRLILIVLLIVLAYIVVVSFLANFRKYEINRADLVGNWVSNYEQANYKYSHKHFLELHNGIHQLKLREDGKYEYEYVSFDGKETGKNSGVWRFEYKLSGSRPYIVLSDFAFGPSKFQAKKFSTSRPVTRFFGSIRITINDDYGYYFRKEE